MRLKYWICVGALGLAASGCSSNEILIKKQTEMEARMEQLIQANAGNTAQLAELATMVAALQGQVKANARDLEEMKPDSRGLKKSPEVGTRGRDGTALQPENSKIVLVGKEAATGDRASVEQDSYMKAFGLFSSNKYDEAAEAFKAFIRAHPDSEYAGNAQYWIGECYYTQRDYTRALEAFNKAVENYPSGSKVPDALLKAGYSLISLNEHAKARVPLETLVEKYPKSPAAAKARERLSR